MPKGKTVLVVDDAPELVRAHARMLKNHWDVVTAGTVPEAIEKMSGGGIDVVLSDWNMPGGGGQEVLDAGRDLGIPVVIISAGAEMLHAVREVAAGLVSKPSHLTIIDRALWAALGNGQKPAKIH